MTDKPKAKAKAKPKAPEQKNYFSEKELRCRHSHEYKFDDDFLKLLNSMRDDCGFAFPITSGYRSETHPIEARKIQRGRVAGCPNTGKAVDIAVKGAKAQKVIESAVKHGITRIGVQQKGNNRFIHIDACKQSDFPDSENFPECAIWSY